MGIDEAGCPSETPPTKTTASMPSRSTVMSGRTNSTHLPVRPPRVRAVPAAASAARCACVFSRNARLSFTRHFAFARSILSIVMPMPKMSSDATSSKMPGAQGR